MQAVYHVRDRDLSWRERAAFLRHLPADCAVSRSLSDAPLWTLTDYLLDDVRMWLMVVAGVAPRQIKSHPQRPVVIAPPDPERMKRFREQAARIRERKRRRAHEAPGS